ncbi:transposable element gene [Prunus dulcis]|uniref:Transposable element protein n=1 Tax=Prunus dulcis TaxID=3755 RepID=A0A4Y1QZE9_PRUDU|nr:transposable element gene [Prunus dulcis]
MWYNRLSKYLLKEGYTNDPICPCVFIKKSESGFAIVAVYVDDMNLIGTSEELQKTADYLKREFEMKDLGKTKYCLGLQIEHSANGILVHQSTYTEKVLKRFGMDKAHPLSTPMVVRSLDTKKDPYRPKGDDEMVLGPEVPYLSAIGALLYLAQCTRPDISFSVNLLARYSSAPTRRHWTGIKHVLRYLRGTTDMGLFYSSESTNAQSIVGYADAGYLSDPHQGRSQTGYVFTCGGTAISWRSTKQTLVATSSNHSEILALHEASRECVWLRSVIHHIRSTCALPSATDTQTILNEDNAACIAQIT